MPTRQPRSRRTQSHWEPFFDPNLTTNFNDSDWDFSNNAGPQFLDFSADSLKSAIGKGVVPHFRKIHFENCDFSGRFDTLDRRISFIDCSFEACDFGLTTWAKTRFTGCQFDRTSFSQAQLDGCEFIDCKWKNIGYSGTTTSLLGTALNNPSKFVRSK